MKPSLKARSVKLINFILLLTILTLLQPTQQITLSTVINEFQVLCMNEILQAGDKYQFNVYSHSSKLFQINIGYSENKKFIQLYRKNNTQKNEVSGTRKYSLRVSKKASAQGTYLFCIKNIDTSPGMFNITIINGEKIIDLSQLPQDTDVYRIDKQITWVDSVLDELQHKMYNIQLIKLKHVQITNLVNKNMIVFAIGGLMVIGFVNIMFYWNIKKELKKRKLI